MSDASAFERPMCDAPAYVIRLPLEGAPTVHLVAMYEGDELRLRDWIGNRPRLARIVGEALDAARRAA